MYPSQHSSSDERPDSAESPSDTSVPTIRPLLPAGDFPELVSATPSSRPGSSTQSADAGPSFDLFGILPSLREAPPAVGEWDWDWSHINLPALLGMDGEDETDLSDEDRDHL